MWTVWSTDNKGQVEKADSALQQSDGSAIGREVVQSTATRERMAQAIQAIIDEETELFGRRPSVTLMNRVPDTMRIPLGGNGLNWIKVPDLICCFVDMQGSTKLSAELHERGTAKAYRYFTNTAILLLAAAAPATRLSVDR
jgi:hypothetical protein